MFILHKSASSRWKVTADQNPIFLNTISLINIRAIEYIVSTERVLVYTPAIHWEALITHERENTGSENEENLHSEKN